MTPVKKRWAFGNAGDAEVKDLHAALADLSEEKPGTFDAIAEASDGMTTQSQEKSNDQKGKSESCKFMCGVGV